MKRSLVFKLCLCYIILISVIYGIVNTFGASKINSTLDENYTSQLSNISTRVSSANAIKNYFSDSSTLDEAKEYLCTISEYVLPTIWIVDKDGNIIADSSNPSYKSGDLEALDTSSDFFTKSSTFKASIPQRGGNESLFYITKIHNKDALGYVVTMISDDYVSSQYARYITLANFYLLFTLPIIAIIFILIYFLTIEPVHRITKYAVEYSKGQFDYKLVIKSNDEYKQLADAIQYMVGELNNLDEYQRKFIGNISHDFRSPLTSIKGYVEAMIDGTIPVDNQSKYLNIILFEAERLTELTTNLLTLNNFDNNKRILDKKSFDINYILKKTGEVYEGRCSRNKIEIVLNFESPTLFVYADQSQIQQVINNLVDNAIKFSPQYSKIVLSTFVRNDKIFVSIKDSGSGIPKNSINKIWERFYKTDPSRGKDKKGTGLGLAITKEIINAHHENINVVSTEGIGTEFIFTLSKPNGSN